jgi:hypothetical protein
MPIIDIISSMICDDIGDHAARIASSCMLAISQREAVEWVDKINLGFWTKKCVEKWSWLPEVLEGLLALVQAKLVFYLRILFLLTNASQSFSETNTYRSDLYIFGAISPVSFKTSSIGLPPPPRLQADRSKS